MKPQHEQLFDEICNKLSELSLRSDSLSSQDRLQRMQLSLQKSQEELKMAQSDLEEKMQLLGQNPFSINMDQELSRLSQQIDTERTTNSKLSADLAKSLELNLKLQFEIEEVRSKMTQSLGEEKKHNIYLTDKTKSLTQDLELSEALQYEAKLELQKAKEHIEIQSEELKSLTESLEQFEAHAQTQNEVLKNLSSAAEKKMIELKMALDKKSLESQDYYSHLQQSMSQTAVLRQENSALKEYISKLSNLQQNQVRAQLTPQSAQTS